MWRETPESPRIFENDLLDGFSRVPWYVIPAVYVPFVTALLGWSWSLGVHPGPMAGQFAVGLVVWSLMEYWLHRTVFHWVPATSWGPRFHFLVHGVHHDWFKDRMRLVMPPAASLALAVVVWSLIAATQSLFAPLLTPTWGPGFFAGVVAGYLVYDLTHYHLHHGKPATRIGQLLRAHHNKHHHNERFHDKKFGVSTTLWDHVFGTYE
jgi:dihydroceramide fatty acyl 2-hydroxylase